MSDYWDDQATDIESATHAVFSEPGIEAHSTVDVSVIVTKFGTGLPPGEILDVGCGIGRLSGRVADAMTRRVAGFDTSPRMVALADEHHPHPSVTYSTEFPSHHFAAAFSMLVFQHLPADAVKATLARVHAVLKLGGRFVVQYVEGDYHVDHDHRYLASWIQGRARKAGFTVVRNESRDAGHQEWRWLTLEKR